MTSVTGRDGTPSGRARNRRPSNRDGDVRAIMLGLYNRERTDTGSKVGTSLMASGAWAHSCDLQARMLARPSHSRCLDRIINPLSAAYVTRDAKVFLLIQLDPEHEFHVCARCSARPSLRLIPMFANDTSRTEHAAELFAILQSQFESKDLSDWRKAFKEHDISGRSCRRSTTS